MKFLKLLKVDRYVERNGTKQVTSTKIYDSYNKTEFDKNGLFSEDIFGALGSKERRSRMGYINLYCQVIHPESFKILSSISPDINKLIAGHKKYILNEKNMLQEDDEFGDSGIYYFTQIIEKINFEEYCKNKPKVLTFLDNYKKFIVIDKILVLPAGIRDIVINNKRGAITKQHSEITALYDKLLKTSLVLSQTGGNIDLLPVEIVNPLITKIQSILFEINEWIHDKLGGKYGLIKGGLFKKVLDFSGRLVITPGLGLTKDDSMDLGWVGISWNKFLKLHEPFAIHELFIKNKDESKLIQSFLKINRLSVDDIKKFLNIINNDPDCIPAQLKSYLVQVANDIAVDRLIIYKRDPVEEKGSWMAAFCKIEDTNDVLKINPLDLQRCGGDYDGDQLSFYAILTNQGKQDAKDKMCPITSKSSWQSGSNAGRINYGITLDASTAIYSATKIYK